MYVLIAGSVWRVCVANVGVSGTEIICSEPAAAMRDAQPYHKY